MSVKTAFDLLGKEAGLAFAPIAFYPGRKLIGATMEEILSDSNIGAKCLAAIQNTLQPSMLIRMTELWVEAEAFGAEIAITEHSFPAIKNKVLPEIEDIGKVNIPGMDAGRLPVFIDTIRNARKQFPDLLLFAGVTGPFSLGSCLTDSEELMMACYTDPDEVHAYLEKITEFIISYCREYKAAGASGVFIAEPSVCMLSPELAEEFSHHYLKQLINEVQDDDFAVVYHNCGDVTPQLESIKNLGAMAYHFGDAVSMQKVLQLFPNTVPILGNIHPAKFMPGKEDDLLATVNTAKQQYGQFPNFILSTGCDVAPDASVEALQTLMISPDFL